MNANTKFTVVNLANNLPILQQGSSNVAVAVLQQLLTLEGYGNNLPITGFFGSETYTAVLSLQQALGLQQDGVVGPDTWNALAEFQANGD